MKHTEKKVKFTLRVPETIYKQLNESIKTTKRSMAGEIIYTLQQAFGKNRELDFVLTKDVHHIVREEIERFNQQQAI